MMQANSIIFLFLVNFISWHGMSCQDIFSIIFYNNYVKGMETMVKKIIACLLVFCVVIVLYNQCTKGSPAEDKNIKVFTAFFDTSGQHLDSNNKIKMKIAEITGARCDETWLNGRSRESAVNDYIASGEYPDFVPGGKEFLEAGALLPVDQYWEDYPNIYNYMPQEDWDSLRQEDGHIYWIPQFGVVNGKDCEVVHQGEAFWIQTRVLKWAGYPDIRTVEEYFSLVSAYVKANPVMEDGRKNIPFTILCDDWKFFCLENVPQFLDGYPNDGCCITDPVTRKVMDYNVTPTAKKYFKLLNREFKNGIIDPESFTSTYEEYLEKLSTGAVLGMVDQWWDFAYDINASYDNLGLAGMGCSYVPLPITISRDIKNQWHVKRSNELNVSSGIAVTVSCKDVKGAFQFINDLLGQEVQNLRFWGIKGEDYEADSNGLFYKTPEQGNRTNNPALQTGHFCMYPYFPRIEGISKDGINAFSPEYQESIFFDSLAQDVKECFEAYGCKNYVDMLGGNEQPGKWYPLYSYALNLTYSTEAGRVWKDMDSIKRQWLPRVVMADDFEETWDSYMKAYNGCNPGIFFRNLQQELNRRIKSK